MIGYNYPTLKEFVKLVEKLHKVEIGMTESDYKNNTLWLHTNSPYGGLDKLRFEVTKKDEETDLQRHIKRLKNNPNEAMMYAKACMLNYLVANKPKLESSERFIRLLELVNDERISVEYFEKLMKRKSSYVPISGLLEIVKQKVIEPVFKVRGKKIKRIVEGDLIEKDESEVVLQFTYSITVDPLSFGKALMEESKPWQHKFEEEEAKRLEKEKIDRYIS